jgi:hypothetical protein
MSRFERTLTNERVGKKYVCAVEGCDRLGKGRYCGAHTQRLRSTGELGPAVIRRRVPPGTPPVEKLELIGWTEDESGCWIYNGRRDPDGYGLMDDLRQTPIFAHRVAYGKWVGPVPDGKVLMHSCDNPPCVNPAHLSIGTQEDNLHDMWSKGRGKVVPHQYRETA